MKPFVMVILAAGSLLLAGQRKPVHKTATLKSVVRKSKNHKPVIHALSMDDIPQRFTMQLLFR